MELQGPVKRFDEIAIVLAGAVAVYVGSRMGLLNQIGRGP